MPKENEELFYNRGLLERTAKAREAKGWTQDIIARALGVPLERYKKYETRSTLPPYLIERFCRLCRQRDDLSLTRGQIVPYCPHRHKRTRTPKCPLPR
jgi:transcriptional regulator with XRE-family HTH domain